MTGSLDKEAEARRPKLVQGGPAPRTPTETYARFKPAAPIGVNPLPGDALQPDAVRNSFSRPGCDAS